MSRVLLATCLITDVVNLELVDPHVIEMGSIPDSTAQVRNAPQLRLGRISRILIIGGNGPNR